MVKALMGSVLLMNCRIIKIFVLMDRHNLDYQFHLAQQRLIPLT